MDEIADEAATAEAMADMVLRLAVARREAAADRTLASNDRRAAAGERRQASLDRRTALADRGAGAGERSYAELDRGTSLADRGAGAGERSHAELDRGTASADRGAGAGERTQAEHDRGTSLADRGAGAGERTQAEQDRGTSLADRGAGAGERTQAEQDRGTSFADRGASAREREHAATDELTGVYLRGPGFVALQRDIARARQNEQQFTVAFVDVDHLKKVNDSGGHAAGDRLLVDVATALGAKLRSHDLIVRYGGDEFVCAFFGVNAVEAARRLALVNAVLADRRERASISFGVAELRPDDSADVLVARADVELYREREQRHR